MPVFLVTNKSLTDNIATLTTDGSHGMETDTYFTVAGIDATFNGSYTVLTAPTSNTFTYSKTASNVSSTPVSGGSVIYATFDSNPRPGFMYDEESDQWKPIAGQIDTGRNYIFTGTHTHQAHATFEDNVAFDENISVSGSASFAGPMQALAGINVFTNETQRDSIITSPETGTIVYLIDTNKQLVYNGSAWVAIEGGSGMEDIFLLMGA